MLEEKDKEIKFNLSNDSIDANLKLKNQNNRVLSKVGDIIIDKLSYYR